MAKNRSIAIPTTTITFIILLMILRRRDARSSAKGPGVFTADDGSISPRRDMRMLPSNGDPSNSSASSQDLRAWRPWPPLPHSLLRRCADLQWPGPGRPLGLGQSDRRLFGLFGSIKSCLKMKSPLGETIVGGIFRTSLIGVDF